MNYTCLECGYDEIQIDQDCLGYVDCPDCKAQFSIEVDAEFVDGMWRDRTKLIKIKDGYH